MPSTEAHAIGDPHLARALELDPELAEARSFNAGVLFWYHWDYERGIEESLRALDLDPNDARARVFYGHMLMIMERPEEAREQGELAIRLDPLDPFVRGLHGTLLAGVAPEEAIPFLEALLEDHPGIGFGWGGLRAAYHRAGRPDDAARVQRDRAVLAGSPWVAAWDEGMAAGGRVEAARRAAELQVRLSEESYVSALNISMLFMQTGDTERALDWLGRSVEQRDQNLPYLSIWEYEPLHDHPRFQAVLEEIGVPLSGG
jgi:tetratricopeptide (TPR) repeat protein